MPSRHPQLAFRSALLALAWIVSPVVSVGIEPSAAMIDQHVERILLESDDAKLRAHAREYQRLAGRRRWREFNPVDGAVYLFYATFEAMTETPDGRPAVKFRKYLDPFPLAQLSVESRDELRLLLDYQQEFAAHFAENDTALSGVSGGLASSSSKPKKIEIAVLKVATVVDLDGVEITLNAGDKFRVLSRTIDEVQLVVAGSSVSTPRDRVELRKVTQTVTAKPVVLAELGLAGVFRASGDALQLHVVSVDPEGPGAGLRAGDVIFSVDGVEFTKPSVLLASLGEKPTIRLAYRRGSSIRRLMVATGLGPGPAGYEVGTPIAGPVAPWPPLGFLAETNPAGDLEVRYLVDKGTIAEQIGLAPGDRILLVNNQRVRALDDIRRELERTTDAEVDFVVIPNGEELNAATRRARR